MNGNKHDACQRRIFCAIAVEVLDFEEKSGGTVVESVRIEMGTSTDLL